MPVRVWTSPTGQGGYEIYRIHPRALLSAPWGTCSLDEIEVFYRTLLRLIDETEGGRTTLVLDYRRIVNAGPDQRKLFERSMESRRHLVGSLVFVTNSPVLRLLVRLGRHFKRHGCELRICGTREEGIRIGCELASAADHEAKQSAPSTNWLRGSFFSRFFLRRQAAELKSLLADFPWDSRKPVDNPLPQNHPFHELFELWWTVKREIDQVDKERQEFQDELGATLKSLGESEQRYRAVFLASGAPLFLLDQNRRIRMANPAAQTLLGKFGEHELKKGVDWLEHVHPDDRPRLLEYHERRLHDSRLPAKYACRVIDRQGHTRDVEANIEIVVGTSLRVISLVDLTDLRRLDAEKDSLQARLDLVTAELEKLRAERAYSAPLHVGESLSVDRPGGLASASTAIARQVVLETEPPSPSALRILVVEDDIPLSGVLRDYLEAVGHDVRCSEGGTIALEILASSEKVDIVLLDLQMRDMDGLEVLRRLRTMPGRQSLPVIVLTGLAFDSDLRNCMEAGADRHVSKPFLMEELVRNIAELHAEHRSTSRR